MTHQSPQELADAFARCLHAATPSSAQCRRMLTDGGWTAASAASWLGIHACWVERLLKGQHVNLRIRQAIAKLPSESIQPPQTRP